MYARLKSVASSMVSLAGAGALLLGLASSDALAQKFEYTYGGPLCTEAGRGGVQPVSRGGYIAAGESFSPDDCASSDIYLVRTNNDGSLAWSLTYDVGGQDSATDVQEVLLDPEGKGGFIITGVTDNRGQGECRPSRDLFLLRVDDCGNVIWMKTYGSERSDEIGWDVIETQTGDGGSTNKGDFVVAGSTAYYIECPAYDGYILRVNSKGDIIWDAVYDGPERLNDYFYAVEECIVTGSPSGSAADIVAAGGSNSYGTGSYDAWIVRVDGRDGRFNGGSQNAVAYGGRGFEELRSIQELRHSCGDYNGHLVAVGRTNLNLRASEVYIIQTAADPCKLVNHRALGDRGSLADEGYCIREVPFDNGALRRGDLAITGYMTPRKGQGHGGRDLFLKTYIPGTLASPTTYTTLYGGSRTDWGWSLSPVEGNECRTAGLVVAGFTSSPKLVDPYDPQQLYLIKTDLVCETSCSALRYRAVETRPEFESICKLPEIREIREQCEQKIERTCQYWMKQICLDMEGIAFCGVEHCDCIP